MVLAAGLSVTTLSSLALAQSTSDNDRCKVMDTRQYGNGKHQGNDQAPGATESNPSKKLSDCAGVLKPPAVGDSQIEKPAPRVGDTPVIRPGETQSDHQPKR